MPKSQKRSSSKGRSMAPLNANLDRRVMAYLAAAAAGLGLVSVPTPADAEIIYTPCNIPMAQGGNGPYPGLTALDLNNDGVADFQFSNYIYETQGMGESYLRITPQQAGNQIAGVKIAGQRQVTASVLAPDVRVGPNANFGSYPQGINMAIEAFGTFSGFGSGNWSKVETAFLGLKFVISGQVHYGWALVKFPNPGGFTSASIYGYAYESVPNKPIITGQTHGTVEKTQQSTKPFTSESSTIDSGARTLGWLAAGSRGLPVGRQYKSCGAGVNESKVTL